MRIKHLSVKNLFGIFNHDIPLNRDDRITIIYGPDGFGKTFTLRLVNELFNPGYGDFYRIPFDTINVVFEDGSTVSVVKHETAGEERLVFEFSREGAHPESYHRDKESESDVQEPSWFAELKEKVTISLIDTERLKQLTENDWQVMSKTIEAHFRENTEKIELLIKIINSRFVQKRLDISRQGGFIFTTSQGRTLQPDQLSSGEKHVIVLYYELLFKVRPDSLILIDEPELSLHIVWQQQFLRDLQAIIGLSGFDTLIATHSPQIIHDRWDLAVELKGPGE